MFVDLLYVFLWEVPVHFRYPCLDCICKWSTFVLDVYIVYIVFISLRTSWQKFSHAVGCLFILLVGSFVVLVFQFDVTPSVNACGYFLRNCSSMQGILSYTNDFKCPAILSYSTFNISAFMFRSLTHFYVSLVHEEKYRSSLNIPQMNIQFSQHNCW